MYTCKIYCIFNHSILEINIIKHTIRLLQIVWSNLQPLTSKSCRMFHVKLLSHDLTLIVRLN